MGLIFKEDPVQVKHCRYTASYDRHVVRGSSNVDIIYRIMEAIQSILDVLQGIHIYFIS